MKCAAFLGLLLLPAAPAAAVEFDLGAAGSVTADVPGGWSQPVADRPEDGVIQFRISSQQEGNASVLGKILVGADFSAPAERLKSEFELSCSPYLMRATEDSLDVRPLDTGNGAVGFFVTLTEADLVDAPAGGHRTKTSTRCVFVLSDTVKALVTIYCDDPGSVTFQQAMAIVQSLRHNP